MPRGGRRLAAQPNALPYRVAAKFRAEGEIRTHTRLPTGGGKILGPDGKLLFSDAGQVRFEAVVDFMGTLDDPSDDVLVEDHGLIKGSTGTNDLAGRDFCDDMQEFTS